MIADFEARILALIDDMVAHASDDELFASGYLRGHLTLAVAEAEENGEHTLDALYDRVRSSLARAIGNGELSPPDQALVLGMWQQLYAKYLELHRDGKRA
ncbi:YfcL family protein [Martelella alba]|uniref:YfcL family protein n=1 Tax=Martelella alba TaxID=2590451 RepID=A0ABY2SGA7_9HYPH|nr:YfcL family protein [Martelella alba]TKI03874.1 YfcL family protein [Martelella alba]